MKLTDTKKRPAALAAAAGLVLLARSVALAAPSAPPPAPAQIPTAGPFADPSGTWSNVITAAIGANSPFLAPLGTNGRSCATCHSASDAWSVTPGGAQRRFLATNGADPLFASVDGMNCPTLPTSTLAAKQAASSLMLTKGLVRVQLTPPANAQFAVAAVANPYGCGSTAQVSVYRRILPTANLAFLSDVMWDGRESYSAAGASSVPVQTALSQQASDAVTIHEAGARPSLATLAATVSFEVSVFAAQISDALAGALNANGGLGGTLALSRQIFTSGANNPFGPTTPTQGVTPSPAFTVYAAWEAQVGTTTAGAAAARASIGRGEKIFNTRPILLQTVTGLNDQIGADGRLQTKVIGTCATCHNAPNAGSNTTGRMFDTGVSHPENRTGDLPLITLVNRSTGAAVQTTDPGLALTSGRWSDVNRFKVPTLRNLSARAPYFHNGAQSSLDGVVNFYNNRFSLGLSTQEHADLVAFLKAL